MKIRRRLFPTKHQRTVDRWFAANGDNTLRLEYPLNKDSFIMDVGGYIGDWAAAIQQRYDCEVAIFEPLPHGIKRLEERFRNRSKIRIYPIGLAGESGFANLTDSMDGSSVYGEALGIRIQLVSIFEWLQKSNVSNIDLIKINIEGGEYSLLEKLIEVRALNLFRFFQIQFHPTFEGYEKRINTIHEHLSQTHRLQWEYPLVWESWERI